MVTADCIYSVFDETLCSWLCRRRRRRRLQRYRSLMICALDFLLRKKKR